jgi:hypothetical protein
MTVNSQADINRIAEDIRRLVTELNWHFWHAGLEGVAITCHVAEKTSMASQYCKPYPSLWVTVHSRMPDKYECADGDDHPSFAVFSKDENGYTLKCTICEYKTWAGVLPQAL